MRNENTSFFKNIVYCDGGLCNRLNEILFVLILREKFGGAWEIVWPQTNWCGAGFDHLFSIDMPVSEEIPNYFNSNKYKFIIHENYGGFEESRITFHTQLDSYHQYGLFLTGREPVYYTHSIIPSFVTIGDLALALQHLRVDNAILLKVIDFCAQHQIDEKVIGLHIRKTDFENKVNEDELYLLAHQSLNRFFVCSDDRETNYRFSRLPNCIIFEKKSFPEKLMADRGWNTVVMDNENKVIQYNLNRPEESVIEALIDLLILSKTTLVETSGSTFLRMAMYFQATKYLDSQRLIHK